MTEFMEIVKDRRSVRKYEEREIPGEVMDTVMEAARWAPSWANTQCWEIVVVKDPAVKEKLQGVISPKNPATKAMVQAPVLLVITGKLGASGYYNDKVTTKFGDWFMYDLGIFTQNICLAAVSRGLGTVIVGLFDHDKAKEILNVPEGYEVVTILPMGYPAKISSPPKRREVAEFTHDNSF